MKKTYKKRTRFRLLVLPLIFVLIPLLPQKNTAEAAGSRVILNQGAFEEATVDWNVMVERLDEAIRNGKGENVNFSVGNIFTVPVDLLEKLAGQNATLALHANDEYHNAHTICPQSHQRFLALAGSGGLPDRRPSSYSTASAPA